MNKIFKLFVLLFWGISWMTSCSPDEISIGEANVAPEDLVEGIAFKIEHDAANPNIVYLKNLMGSQYTPLWNHPQGRSQEQTVTLKIPFAGDYEVQFGVETRGGIVYGEPVTFHIDNMYAEFISDPLWILLAGGAGEEKTWYLDLDADAVSRYFVGPLFFYGVDDSWLTVTEGQTIDGDSWNWQPDYKGNSWLFAAADFGTMTFDLKGGAHVTVEHLTIPDRGREQGSYMIDVDNHTMKMVDATPLHDINRDGVVVNWGDIKILSLTENSMQLGVLRDKALSGEDPCLLVYNFISKEYKDNWTPGETVEPEPALPDNWQNDVSQIVSTSIKWVLSPTTPFNWANLDGSLMNSWNTVADYPDWTGFDASIPATYAAFSLTLDSDDHSVIYVAPDGVEQTGTYTLDEKGYYTFTGVTPAFNICSWVNLNTSAENQWRIVKIEKNASNKVTGMWVGVRDPEKPEYMVWKLEPQSGGGTGSDPLNDWKKALAGKTFTPDVNWFVDWVGFPPDFSGGWTSSSTFGDDYTSNGWVWDADVREVAESATLRFFMEGSTMKVELNQMKEGTPYSATGTVTIDPVNNILNIDIPLVDYTGTVAAWLGSTNPKSLTGNEYDWYFVSHGGSNLGNIDSNGFWLGRVTNSIAAGDTSDEVLIFHYVKQ
ncbi:MAG: hypothetical protein LBP83_04925 [Dysgonamonadaceae bacterium]|jgi:hypothetical protein|nr:hypothetical protein [Dysgonamonadaceae bacterium]